MLFRSGDMRSDTTKKVGKGKLPYIKVCGDGTDVEGVYLVWSGGEVDLTPAPDEAGDYGVDLAKELSKALGCVVEDNRRQHPKCPGCKCKVEL